MQGTQKSTAKELKESVRNMSHETECQWKEQACKRNQKKCVPKVYTEMKITQAGFGSIGEREGKKKNPWTWR